MAATKKNPEHYFVITAMGASAHRHGPFVDRDTAIAWVRKHYANWPCWLMPGEYIGVVSVQPLNADGERIAQEG
jgi:hypothetical protein